MAIRIRDVPLNSGSAPCVVVCLETPGVAKVTLLSGRENF